MERPVIERLQRGDTRPYGWLVERHQPRVRAIIARIIGPVDDLDDLVQQTFVSAWRTLATFDAQRPFAAWLNRIAINLAKDWRKARRRSEVSLAIDPEGPAAHNPETAAAQREELARLALALDDLPQLDRELIVAKCLEEQPYLELSRRLQRPVGALKIRVVRARLRLLFAVGRDRPRGDDGQ